MKMKHQLLFQSAKYNGLWNAVMTPPKMKKVSLMLGHSVHVFTTVDSVVEFTDAVRGPHPTLRPIGDNWYHVEHEGIYKMYQWQNTELHLVLYTDIQQHPTAGPYVGWGLYL
jgi:hypothetical protein